MKCPYCGHTETKVLESRDNDELDIIRRRRECLKCEKRFTTHEAIESADLLVIKKDGTKQKFDRDKLLVGLMRACEKRPVSVDLINKTVDDIERSLRRLKTVEVKSSQIGELVMKRLRQLDSVAFIRFASVYKDFEDLNTFEKEIQLLREARK